MQPDNLTEKTEKRSASRAFAFNFRGQQQPHGDNNNKPFKNTQKPIALNSFLYKWIQTQTQMWSKFIQDVNYGLIVTDYFTSCLPSEQYCVIPVSHDTDMIHTSCQRLSIDLPTPHKAFRACSHINKSNNLKLKAYFEPCNYVHRDKKIKQIFIVCSCNYLSSDLTVDFNSVMNMSSVSVI